MHDTTLMVTRDPQVCGDENTPEEKQRARNVVRFYARDIDESEQLLMAIGERPYEAPDHVVPSREPAHRRALYAAEKAAERAAEPRVHGDACPCHNCRNKRCMSRARARAAEDPELIPHHTISGYKYWGCREECCLKARSEYRRIARIEKKEREQ